MFLWPKTTALVEILANAFVSEEMFYLWASWRACYVTPGLQRPSFLCSLNKTRKQFCHFIPKLNGAQCVCVCVCVCTHACISSMLCGFPSYRKIKTSGY